MKVYVVSLGCPKNLTDTEVLMGKLVASGYEIINHPARAEIIIINTCAFLRSARDEAKAVIKEMVTWKKQGKCRELYIAGCYPRWAKALKSKALLRNIDGIIESIGLFDYCTPRLKATPSWTAYVKIAEGCNNCCSYCLIPKIRGKLHTRKPDDVLKEVEILAGKGVKEIIFIAQDTTAYPHLSKLLKQTARISGLRWIRLMYAHPAHLKDEVIEAIASEKKIVKYLDLPIQHVCDRILRQINRRYQRKDLEDLIQKLRARIPGLALRTSVIVGLPGEGEKEFSELLEFVKREKFDHLGAFKYEREKRTVAAKMKGQVKEKDKEERFNRLMRVQSRISKELNQRMSGNIIEVLVEGKNYGRSYRDAPEIDGKVIVKSPRPLNPGGIIGVKIIGARTYDLIGVPVPS